MANRILHPSGMFPAIVGVIVALFARPVHGSTFTMTSPTAGGELPDNVTAVGGVVYDFIGANDRRFYSQLASSSLYVGQYATSPGEIGTQTGWSAPLVNALGGTIKQAAVRITLYDGDNAAGEFDFNDNTLLVNGVSFGNWSTVNAQHTDGAGDPAAGGFSGGGFRNNRLDTGWFLLEDPDDLQDLYDALEATGELVIELTDVDPNDNFFDFKQGIDAGLVGGGAGPAVSVTLAEVAHTERQRRVGAALDTIRGSGGDLSDVIDLIDLLPFDDDIRAALDQMTNRLDHLPADSVIHAMTAQGFHLNSRLSALHRGQIEPVDVGALNASLASAGGLNQRVVDLADRFDPYDGLVQTAVDAPDPSVAVDPLDAPADPDRFSVFAVGALSWGDFDRTHNQLPADFETGSIMVGFDRPVTPDVRVGLAFGYADQDADFDDGSRFDSYTVAVFGFGTWNFADDWFADAMIGYGYSEVQTHRRIAFFGVDRLAHGSTHSDAFTAAGRVVRTMEFGQLTVAPEATVRYVHVDVAGYSESGAGGASLVVDDDRADSFTASAGVFAALTEQAGDCVFVPYGGVSLEYEFAHDRRYITHAFTGAPGTPFDSPTDEPDRFRVNLSGGLTVQVSDRVSVYGDYTTQLFNDLVDDHTVRVGLRISF